MSNPELSGGQNISPKELIEMDKFGFDPSIPGDVEKWKQLAPLDDSTTVDYDEDAREVGRKPADK